jgi:hypothetical protein
VVSPVSRNASPAVAWRVDAVFPYFNEDEAETLRDRNTPQVRLLTSNF